MATVADVVIIGGGIAGASLGYRLAEHCKVIVLEGEDQPGYHATGRSAALYTATYGQAAVRALTRASLPFLSAPPSGFAQTALLTRRGALWVARADQGEALAQFVAAFEGADLVHACTGAEALNLCPVLRAEYVDKGAYEPGAADIDVHALHLGYMSGLRALGGALVTSARVRAIRRRGDTWEVEAGGAVYASRVLVNAAGAWGDEVAVMADVSPIGVTPKRRTALTFEPPQGTDARGWPSVLDADEQFYFKPDAGRVLASPGDETPSAPTDAQPEQLDLAVTVDRIETATTLQISRLASKWAGLRTFVDDKVPVVGMDTETEGFFWLVGQGGYGIMTSPAMSELAAALILGKTPPPNLIASGVAASDLSPARIPPEARRKR